jgi:hypothetical protein
MTVVSGAVQKHPDTSNPTPNWQHSFGAEHPPKPKRGHAPLPYIVCRLKRTANYLAFFQVLFQSPPTDADRRGRASSLRKPASFHGGKPKAKIAGLLSAHPLPTKKRRKPPYRVVPPTAGFRLFPGGALPTDGLSGFPAAISAVCLSPLTTTTC